MSLTPIIPPTDWTMPYPMFHPFRWMFLKLGDPSIHTLGLFCFTPSFAMENEPIRLSQNTGHAGRSINGATRKSWRILNKSITIGKCLGVYHCGDEYYGPRHVDQISLINQHQPTIIGQPLSIISINLCQVTILAAMIKQPISPRPFAIFFFHSVCVGPFAIILNHSQCLAFSTS